MNNNSNELHVNNPENETDRCPGNRTGNKPDNTGDDKSGRTGLFVGLATLDYVFYTDDYPEQNHKIKTEKYTRYVGGPAANAAITYSLLGGEAVLVTCLGKSLEAQTIKGILNEYGVKVIDCADDSELPTIATIVVDGKGERTIFSGQRRFEKVKIPALDNLAAATTSISFALFDLNRQEIALELLEELSCEVVLDAGNWKPNTAGFLKRAAVVISSDTFISPDNKRIFDIPECVNALKAITRGENTILTENGSIPVERAEVVDSLAAGDIFHGAFCYAYYNEHNSFEEALKFAAQIATESVRHTGPREWAKVLVGKNL